MMFSHSNSQILTMSSLNISDSLHLRGIMTRADYLKLKCMIYGAGLELLPQLHTCHTPL